MDSLGAPCKGNATEERTRPVGAKPDPYGRGRRWRWRLRFSLRTLVILVLVYSCLWTITAVYGCRTIERNLRNDSAEPGTGDYIADPMIANTTHERHLTLGEWTSLTNKPAPISPRWYHCETIAVAPFVIRVEVFGGRLCYLSGSYWHRDAPDDTFAFGRPVEVKTQEGVFVGPAEHHSSWWIVWPFDYSFGTQSRHLTCARTDLISVCHAPSDSP